jgi:protoporphyrinogen oxidase
MRAEREILNRIARGMGEAVLPREYSADERRALVRLAEIAIEKNWGTDTHEAVSDWFLTHLAELELCERVAA